MTLAELKDVGPGHILDLGVATDEAVDLVVNGSRIGGARSSPSGSVSGCGSCACSGRAGTPDMSEVQPSILSLVAVTVGIGLLTFVIVTTTAFMKIAVVLFLVRNALERSRFRRTWCSTAPR